MEQKDKAGQWEALLEETFGSTKMPVCSDTPEAEKPELPVAEESAAPVVLKRPFYRKALFWLATALVLVTGLAVWLLVDRLQTQQPQTFEDPMKQEAMELCKNALAAWQEEEYYYIKQTHLSYTHSGAETFSAEYWRSGEDFSYMIDWPEEVGIDLQRYIRLDGILRTGNDKQSETDENVKYFNWETIEDTEDLAQRLTPWPMMFDWENSEIVLGSTSTSNSRYSVSFVVRRDGSVYATEDPYHVNFTFTGDKRLVSITVVRTFAEEDKYSYMNATTYRMITCTQPEASNRILENLEWPFLLRPDKTVPA